MAELPGDTIAAIATATGRGAIGVVRASGPACRELMAALCGGTLQPRQATLTMLRNGDGDTLDQALAVFFPAPASFTGEDILELHCHGGPVILEAVLRRLLELGARPARPGEFSERAFLNDKLDLAQAEAIADLIESQTERAAISAARSLSGEFSRLIEGLAGRMMELRVYVEASIDFPDEEIDFLSEGDVRGRLEDLQRDLRRTLAAAERGRLLREGLKLVIAGKPNAGKSSLLNALSGQASAIVTEIPGTTRDVLREHIQIDGIPLIVADTAGLRDSDDPIEREGVLRARQELGTADHVLIVVDSTSVPPASGLEALDALLGGAAIPAGIPVTVVRNKIDLGPETPATIVRSGFTEVAVSALTGAGMDLLRSHLAGGGGPVEEAGLFSARRRQVDALYLAEEHIGHALLECTRHSAGELVAEELRLAQQSLGTITGTVHNDELLGEIFSSFCIGK